MAGRVLTIDLARPGEARLSAALLDGAGERIGGWGGSALGLALLVRHARRAPGAPTPLVLAVGEAVRAGLPTAARATVMTRAPLTGRFAEGHVGGELGPRLASLADALMLTGRAPRAGSVLVVEASGACTVEARPDLAGLSPAETNAQLARELGPCAVLSIGPAGERGLPYASLASGHEPPSFVGRGGLGAVLGRLGLKALCLRSGLRSSPARAPELVERLKRSPRLAERARGGTLELFGARASQGELDPAAGAALSAEAAQRATQRHGCRGCPTPCGWVFERADRKLQGARFGASFALGLALGLDGLDDVLGLLAICDRLGMDAKEVGAILALQCRAQELGRLPGTSACGAAAELARRIEALVHDDASPGRDGAAELARALDLEDELRASPVEPGRAEENLAVLLGQSVSTGGADPMRSFPFLTSAASRDLLGRLLAPLPISERALDPRDPACKGRLVFWHENLVTAVDMTGFCAFSAAGLLADDLCALDELARWILPAALQEPEDAAWRERPPSGRLLAAGANLVLLRRELEREWGTGVRVSGNDGHAALLAPGMLDEYAALRGLDDAGGVREDARAALGSPRVLALASLAAEPEVVESTPVQGRALGHVRLRGSGATGPLASTELALELPATLDEVLAAAAADAALQRALYAGGRLIPSVWRAGRRLTARDSVGAGDVLDLVTAIAGG